MVQRKGGKRWVYVHMYFNCLFLHEKCICVLTIIILAIETYQNHSLCRINRSHMFTTVVIQYLSPNIHCHHIVLLMHVIISIGLL